MIDAKQTKELTPW